MSFRHNTNSRDNEEDLQVLRTSNGPLQTYKPSMKRRQNQAAKGEAPADASTFTHSEARTENVGETSRPGARPSPSYIPRLNQNYCAANNPPLHSPDIRDSEEMLRRISAHLETATDTVRTLTEITESVRRRSEMMLEQGMHMVEFLRTNMPSEYRSRSRTRDRSPHSRRRACRCRCSPYRSIEMSAEAWRRSASQPTRVEPEPIQPVEPVELMQLSQSTSEESMPVQIANSPDTPSPKRSPIHKKIRTKKYYPPTPYRPSRNNTNETRPRYATPRRFWRHRDESPCTPRRSSEELTRHSTSLQSPTSPEVEAQEVEPPSIINQVNPTHHSTETFAWPPLPNPMRRVIIEPSPQVMINSTINHVTPPIEGTGTFHWPNIQNSVSNLTMELPPQVVLHSTIDHVSQPQEGTGTFHWPNIPNIRMEPPHQVVVHSTIDHVNPTLQGTGTFHWPNIPNFLMEPPPQVVVHSTIDHVNPTLQGTGTFHWPALPNSVPNLIMEPPPQVVVQNQNEDAERPAMETVERPLCRIEIRTSMCQRHKTQQNPNTSTSPPSPPLLPSRGIWRHRYFQALGQSHNEENIRRTVLQHPTQSSTVQPALQVVLQNICFMKSRTEIGQPIENVTQPPDNPERPTSPPEEQASPMSPEDATSDRSNDGSVIVISDSSQQESDDTNSNESDNEFSNNECSNQSDTEETSGESPEQNEPYMRIMDVPDLISEELYRRIEEGLWPEPNHIMEVEHPIVRRMIRAAEEAYDEAFPNGPVDQAAPLTSQNGAAQNNNLAHQQIIERSGLSNLHRNLWIRQQLEMENHRRYLRTPMAARLDRRVRTIPYNADFNRWAHVLPAYRAPVQEQVNLGATEEMIHEHTTICQFTEISSSIPQNSCIICFDHFEPENNLRKLPCAHIFHVPCVDKWLTANKRCPICRTPIDVASVSN